LGGLGRPKPRTLGDRRARPLPRSRGVTRDGRPLRSPYSTSPGSMLPPQWAQPDINSYDSRRTIACPSRQTHLYVARVESRALRLAVQDIALSRRKHGFDSRRARQRNQGVIPFLPTRFAGRTANLRHRHSRKCAGDAPQMTRCMPRTHCFRGPVEAGGQSRPERRPRGRDRVRQSPRHAGNLAHVILPPMARQRRARVRVPSQWPPVW
jgi:hypothetical protein